LGNIDIITCDSTKQKGTIIGAISVNGTPAKNVWVYAFSEALNCGNAASSDENGNYTITALTINSDTDSYTTGYIVSVHNIVNDDLSQYPVFTYQAYDNVSNKKDATLVLLLYFVLISCFKPCISNCYMGTPAAKAAMIAVVIGSIL